MSAGNIQQSGSDILSYRGDAALAGGYAPDASPYIGRNSNAGIDRMLSELNNQQFAFNMEEYRQKIKDRDESLALIADPNINVDFDVLDNDRPELVKQIDEINKLWLQNPDIQSNPEQYANLQQKIKMFKQSAASSKLRSLEYTKQVGDISNEPNARYRQYKIDHLDDQVKKGLFHKIDPYFKNFQYDKGTLFPALQEEALGNPNPVIDSQGVSFMEQTYGVRPELIKRRFSPATLLQNENDNDIQNIQLLYEDFVRSPFAEDDAFMQKVNAVTNKINQDWGYKEGDANYFEPAFKKVGDSWEVTQSPAVLATALYAEDQYKYQSKKVLSPDYQKQQKTKAETDLAKARGWYQYTTGKALANKYNEQAKLAEKQGNKVMAQTSMLKSEASQPVSEVIGAFYNINDGAKFGSAKDIFDSGKYGKTVEGFKAAGADETWSYAKLDKGNEAAIKMLSMKKIDPETQKETDYIVKPSFVYALRSPDGDINKMKLVGFDASGKLMKAINPEQGIDEVIKYGSGFKENDRTIKLQGAARNLIQELQGSDMQGLDLNAIISNEGAVDVTPLNASDYDETKEYEGDTYYRKGDVWYDSNGDIVQ